MSKTIVFNADGFEELLNKARVKVLKSNPSIRATDEKVVVEALKKFVG